MAQDVMLMGATFNDVPAVELAKSGGGTALFVDVSDTDAAASSVKSGKKFYLADGSSSLGSYLWDWKGDIVELLSTPYENSIALKNTLFDTWEPSKTAKSIVATATAGTFSADLINYSYLLRWQFQCDVAYNEDVTPVSLPYRQIAEIWQAIIKRPNSIGTIESGSFAGNACITLYTAPLLVYYNASSQKAYTYSASYGIYPAAVAATFSNSTSNTPTVTIKTPTISARCHDTYMSLATTPDIDKDNTICKRKCYLYRVPSDATMRCLYTSLIGLFNNPI